MIELRDNQKFALSEAGKMLRHNKRGILCASTGFGKTVVGGEIARRTLSKGNNIIFLVHRKEIFNQFFSTFARFGIQPSLIHAGAKHTPGQQFYLGMVDTFRSRMKKDGFIESLNCDFMVMDEVHWGSYEPIAQRFPGKILGLSASPKASSGKELNEYFDDCIQPVSITDLIRDGYLVKGRTYSIQHDFSKVRLSGKEFNKKEIEAEFKKPVLFEGLLEEYEKHARGLKSIVYSVSVEASKASAALFSKAGYKCFHVDASSEYRDEIFGAFGESDDAILFNVGIATTGYDEPSVRCIMQNFATAQLTKHTQTVGRGARLHEGKKDFIIIDMGRNYLRHGLYGEEVDWIEIFNNPKLAKTKKEETEVSNIECELCGAIVKVSYKTCPYCNTPIDFKEVEHKILTKGTTEEIKQYRIQTLPVHLRVPTSKMNYPMLKEYGKHMGYSDKWANMQIGFRRRGKK